MRAWALMKVLVPPLACQAFSSRIFSGGWRSSQTLCCRTFASTWSPPSDADGLTDHRPPAPGESIPGARPESPLDVALVEIGMENIKKPPLQSLHKAILAGEISNTPVQRVVKNGRVLTTFSVSTGGLWRFPLPTTVAKFEPRDNRDPLLQHHKVTIHDERLGKYAIRELKKGMQVYVEGELEARVFDDQPTGKIRRDREVAVYASGQVMLMTEKGAAPLDRSMH